MQFAGQQRRAVNSRRRLRLSERAAQQLTQNSGSAAGFRPAGELAAEVSRIHWPGKEHSGVKDGFIADEFEQAGEVHARMLAWMAS